MLKSLDLSGRVAVVIGGTSGMGRAMAVGLAEAGADVIPTGRRQALADEVCVEIEALGRKSLRTTVDVTSRSSIDALRDEVTKHFTTVDILINCAGTINRKRTLDVTEAEWDAVQNTNVTGILRACQSFHDLLAANKRGRVINIASLTSYVSLKEVSAYAASKAAVLGLTRSLAIEWAADAINVNAIAPGVFRTDFNKKMLDETPRGKELLMRTPLQRFGKVSEVVGAAVLLASDAASFITGQSIIVDGGFLASGVNC